MTNKNFQLWLAHLAAAAFLPIISYFFMPEVPLENLIRLACLIPLFMLSLRAIGAHFKTERAKGFTWSTAIQHHLANGLLFATLMLLYNSFVNVPAPTAWNMMRQFATSAAMFGGLMFLAEVVTMRLAKSKATST